MTPKRCKWFNNYVGIVLVEDDKGKNHYFIGAGNGLNENIDINLIISFGSPFPRNAGDALFSTTGVRGVEKRSTGTKGVPTVAKTRRTASVKPSRSTTRRK